MLRSILENKLNCCKMLLVHEKTTVTGSHNIEVARPFEEGNTLFKSFGSVL